MCRADELSLRRKANGKVTGEFIIRRFAISNLVKGVRRYILCLIGQVVTFTHPRPSSRAGEMPSNL